MYHEKQILIFLQLKKSLKIKKVNYFQNLISLKINLQLKINQKIIQEIILQIFIKNLIHFLN